MQILRQPWTFWIVTVPSVASALGIGEPKCRCRPSEPCWPQPVEISEFGKTLSSTGVLLSNIRPPASVCHGDEFNAAECKAANETWLNPFWRSEQPGGMQTPLFESQGPFSTNSTLSCDIAAPRDTPCNQGQVPILGIAAQNEDDVIKALDFAHRHNLRVVVKNTGHDYYGRSTASNSFLIWTHRIKHRTVENSFVPFGCQNVPPKQALRIGAGVQWNEAYKAAATVNRTLSGGTSPNGTVGAAGGWLTGAGHSILSPTFGLGVDNVLQFSVVLPSTATDSGEQRVVNVSSCSEPDLFWALRGGGGNSFGVISEVVYQTHDDFTSLVAQINISTANSTLTKELVVELMHSVGTTFFDQHWGGFSFVTPGVPGVSNNTIKQQFLMPKVSFGSDDEKRYNETFNDLENHLRKLSGSSYPVGSISRLSSFQDFLRTLDPTAAAAPGPSTKRRAAQNQGEDKLQADDAPATFGTSRLLPRSLFADREKLSTYLDIIKGSVVLGHSALGGQVAKIEPDSVAAHPGWRKNAIHIITLPSTPITEKQATNQRREVTELAWGTNHACADVASYLNEQTPLEEYWPEAFYGVHWQRLSKIKKEVDPLDQLIVTKGVGSERWTSDGTCRN